MTEEDESSSTGSTSEKRGLNTEEVDTLSY